MKSSFVIAVILIIGHFSVNAQKNVQIPLRNGKVMYADTVFINNTPKSVIYERSKNWILKNFPIQNKDFNEVNKNDSLITACGSMEFSQMDLHNLNQVVIDYKIQIEVYDNAYVYKFCNFKGRLYEKSQYTSVAASKISIEEDYAQYLKKPKMNDYTRRVKQFYKLINQQLLSFNTDMETKEPVSIEYERGPHLE
ncbi:DUF4468 domain-containing protein [Solitalea canadensis]|uniref:DUF4468 domain-containing protein n=1 Tax=Solitalea canadensis (strain ATCC 29591 / DSM 3403 / JCM 21819 / LMG 8368 / NBRC 15130 / NCIMB 12057 / USAM 9D) TaxID=929556 RepID=H8KPM4_SOLCM|nr:DUF4468 domain-containing protein [Solitalea canadensis]AFD05922.1 hypothetical protein Solca_0804 [Solitalea canadensis DSM 3403]